MENFQGADQASPFENNDKQIRDQKEQGPERLPDELRQLELAIAEFGVILVDKSQTSDELAKFSPMDATTSYADSEHVVWNADGYDLVFLDRDRNLVRAKIVPESLPLLKSGKLGERQHLESLLKQLGYNLVDQKFNDPIWRALNKK